MTSTTRTLGRPGLTVSALGLGCMGMSYAYGPADRAESIATIHRALDLGITFLDTAEMYAAGENEKLVGAAIAGRRDEVVLATKFGILIDPDTLWPVGVNGSPEYVRAAIDRSLTRLGVDHIDLYYQHRPDPSVPVEETVGAMAELGQVRAVAAQYDATPAQVALAWVLARGHDVVPIPGTKRRHYLEDNARSLDITLSPENLAQLSDLKPIGDRYPDMSWVNRDTAPLAG